MLEGEQQVILKAEEILEKAEEEFQVFAPDNYLAQLFYSDFTDKLAHALARVNVTLLVEDSQKSTYFLQQMDWPRKNCCSVNASCHPELPCIMIADKKELLIAFHDNEATNGKGDKKKLRTVALWTNYSAFVTTLQMLFQKLSERNRSQTFTK